LTPGNISVAPHYSFADFDAAFGGKVDLLVVPYIPNADATDAAVLAWIRDKAGAGTTILSICAGAQMVADAGVLTGHTATSHHNTLPVVTRTHPEVNWVSGVRYVDSGQFISSAGVTSGLDATLYTLAREFGRDVADRTASEMGYPYTQFLDDPTWIVPTPTTLPLLPNAFRWDPTQIGLLLYDGVREVEVGSIIDTYPHSFAADIRPIAVTPGSIHTRNGLDLVAPEDLGTARHVDRVLVPGTPDAAASAAIDQWASARGLAGGVPAERIHAAGQYAYDAAFRDMARHETNPIALESATGIEYPARDLHLDGPTIRIEDLLRPVALGMLGIGGLLLLRAAKTRIRIQSTARFALHFVEMCLAMTVGMVVYMAIPGVMTLPSTAHQVGMAIAMTVPMVAWMRVRGHGWRHGIEMSLGMLLPWAAVLALVAMGADHALPWLANADGAAMLLGMLAVMVLRPGHSAHGAHAHSPSGVSEAMPAAS
jgi:putative intracellular protease/amidase